MIIQGKNWNILAKKIVKKWYKGSNQIKVSLSLTHLPRWCLASKFLIC